MPRIAIDNHPVMGDPLMAIQYKTIPEYPSGWRQHLALPFRHIRSRLRARVAEWKRDLAIWWKESHATFPW